MQIFVKDKEFYKKVVTIALPVTLQSLINIGINMADTIMLGYFGESQLSASSLANQFLSLFHILCMGIGGGAAVMTAQYWGKRDILSLKKVITLMHRIVFTVATFFMIITLLFPEQIMRIYTPNPELIEKGKEYFSYMAFTYLFLGLSLTSTIVLRSFGAVNIPLYSSLFSLIINVFLNWVFIFGKLGAPRMEIAGAALATLIARIFEFAFICGYLFFFDNKVKYRIKDITMQCKSIISEYFTYSVPVIISDMLLALGNNAVAIVMGRIGSNFVSANAIASVVVHFTTVANHGLANASGIITGNTLGEGEEDKAYRQGVTFFVLSGIIGCIASIIIMIISPYVIGLYNITSETVAIAKELMIAVAINVIFASIASVMTKGVLRGGGDTKFLMVADILFLWIASVPLGILTGLVFRMSPFIIYTALRIDAVIKSLWCIKRLVSKKWIRRI